jgi:hypothetical protein
MGEIVHRSFGLSSSHNLAVSPQTVDLNQDGIADFGMRGVLVVPFPSDDPDNPEPEPEGFSGFYYFSGLNGGSFSFDGAVAIADGASIGPASPWWSAPNAEHLADVGFYANDGSRTFTDLLREEGSQTIAVRFAAGGGGHHYGWIRYRDHVGDGESEFGPQVFDLAYNSVPDQPILSALVPVPEPATGALLGIGAIALLARRRKRG